MNHVDEPLGVRVAREEAAAEVARLEKAVEEADKLFDLALSEKHQAENNLDSAKRRYARLNK